MRKNINKPLKEVLLNSISIDESEYSFLDSSNPLNAQDDIDRLKVIYHKEYGDWAGLTVESCKEWLQGLPTPCTVPFYNNEIHAIGYKIGYINKDSSDQKHCDWVDVYWERMAALLYKEFF